MINVGVWLGSGGMALAAASLLWAGGINSDVKRLVNMEEDIQTIRETQIALVCKLVPEKCPIDGPQ